MRIVVGLSGGVDSSVVALLLKQQGHDVVGLFMINWKDTTGLKSEECDYDNDLLFAKMVAKKIDIPLKVVDLSDYYRERVVDYMFSEYEQGRTPNPDVLCNREIKFDVFMKEALKLGADYVATGHYCRKSEEIVDGKTYYNLLAGIDKNKDQSYFLCQLSQNQLAKAMFPIGDIDKPKVRRLAKEYGLASAEKKDSQGICFVGKVDLPVFLQQKLEAKKGDTIEILADTKIKAKDKYSPYDFQSSDGEKVGEHNGAHFFTVGQRKGINVGGKPQPLFVLGTDVDKNIVYVGQGHEHPLLLRQGLFISNEEIHWIRPDLALKVGEERMYDVRIRYRQPLQKAKLRQEQDGLYIDFEKPQRAIVAGQFAAWYDGDVLLGSGPIS
ncbi:tRNA (5-methylaminomethyl-2-thiouridylate)-methyltransferase [Balneicella halophila]|uniref:tRNA-specific 2-thiouridylase MnmA n=1 Tax=Balneicella halophila TaxID=1537566 RepID=A0A7L4UQ64_BALHA|nr:tRNA 2-thiouridine(34) synthase MnmA [Balneicella halophila]PVX49880.1 tRNA (5-methylaminomethyl-2-thiouridylate)-methyltransferase [Balneicella halophila]